MLIICKNLSTEICNTYVFEIRNVTEKRVFFFYKLLLQLKHKWLRNTIALGITSVREVSFSAIDYRLHYANISVQYTAIFHSYKNDFFQMKKC